MINFFSQSEVAQKIRGEIKVIKESKHFPYHAQGFVSGYKRLINDGEYGLEITVMDERGRSYTQVFLRHRYGTELEEIAPKTSGEAPENNPTANPPIEMPVAQESPTRKERDRLAELIEEDHLWPY